MKYRFLLFSLLVINLTCASRKTPDRILEETFSQPINSISIDQIEKKIDLVKLAISTDPDDPELHRNLSLLYRMVDTPYSRMLSSKEIDRAIRLDPENPTLYMEKGLILMSRRFYTEAEKVFKKLLLIDPDCREALYQLGNMEKREYTKSMCYPDHINKACNYFRRALRGDEEDIKFMSPLIFLKLLSGKEDSFDQDLKFMADNFPDSPDSYLLLGTYELNRNNFRDSEKAFRKALELMPSEQLSHYVDISFLLKHKDRMVYSAIPEENRLEYTRKYWLGKDPSPTTSLNERLLEHYKRVFFAIRLFENIRLGNKGPNTDRGRALIQYGMPSLIDRPFDKQGRSFDGPVIYWKYDFKGYGFKLYFQDEFLNGDFHIPINPQFAMLAGINRAVSLSLKDAYEYPLEFSEFSLNISTVQIRGRDGKTALRISSALPDSIFREDCAEYVISYSIIDNEKNMIYENSFPIECKTLSVGSNSIYYIIERDEILLSPRVLNNSLYVSCISDKVGVRFSACENFDFYDFSGNSLNVSGIAISFSSGEGDCLLWNDPIRSYRSGSLLCVAYEIYNLETDINGNSLYDLTYSIRPLFDRGRYSRYSEMVSRIFGSEDKNGNFHMYNTIPRSSFGSMVSDRVIIDTSSLAAGEYILRIEVEDKSNGDSAGNQTPFSLIAR